MTLDEARAFTKRILSFATVPELEIEMTSGRRAHLRFARNAASTSGVADSTTIGVTAWKGKRKASGSISIAPASASDGVLRRLVADTEALAALSPEDSEYMGPVGQQKYLSVNAYDAATAEMPAAARANLVAGAIAYAKAKKLVCAGIFRNSSITQVLANSSGLFAYFPFTSASFSITTRTTDATGSGYSQATSVSAKSIDCKEAAAIASRKALESRGARELAPGSYTAILEPQAVADIAGSLLFAANARPADEGRSVFSARDGKTKVGEKIFSPTVNIYTDPQNPVVPASFYTSDGLPTQKAYLARNGVLENLSNSRFWAKQKSRQPGPFFVNLIMDGEGKSVTEMIASTERGILLTRLWYVRPVDPQQALITGLTRDGTFYIENGKIAHPVKNFRFNESLVRILGEVEALGTPQRVASSESLNYGDGGVPLLLPAIKVKSFRFTSLSDAV